MMKLFSTVLLTIVSGYAFADIRNAELRDIEVQILTSTLPACVSPRTYYDEIYCSVKVYGLLDDHLNTKYSTLRSTLQEVDQNQLKRVQLAWIHNRDDQCAKIEVDAVIMNLQCAKLKTLESLFYIEQMIKYPNDFHLLLKEYQDRK